LPPDGFLRARPTRAYVAAFREKDDIETDGGNGERGAIGQVRQARGQRVALAVSWVGDIAEM